MSFFSFGSGGPTNPPKKEEEALEPVQEGMGATRLEVAEGQVLTPADQEEEKRIHETPESWREQQ